jgi:uncharacterized protein (DUF1501 family)
MFDITTGCHRDCTGVTRREILRIGSLGLLGLALPDVLRMQAACGAGTEVSCIMLWLVGGPSHHETFDPKPDAPVEVRGEFGVIKTKTGERIGELLPQVAQQTDKLSIIRSVTHTDSNHDTARTYLQSGYKFNVSQSYPSYGSVIAREKGFREGLPPYALLGGRARAEGAGYLGAIYNPFLITGDPSQPGFSVRDVSPPEGVAPGRFQRRERMLAALDRFQQGVETAPVAASMDRFRERAFDLITSPAAKKAVALDEEPQKLRDRYGKHAFGQSCLLARRLIEAGVRFVTVTNGGWDTHQNNFIRLKTELLPRLDQAYSALLEDLSQRGLLENTLVLAMGEFGRTPRVNTQAGRDHWPGVFSVCLGGGPIRTGRIIGASDEIGAAVAERPVKVEDLAATIYRALGIDFHKEFMSPQGRPLPIVHNGEPVAELF